jgi:hypothetical protein
LPGFCNCDNEHLGSIKGREYLWPPAVSFSVRTLPLKVVHVEVGITKRYSYHEVPPEHALHTGVVNMPKITYILFSNLGTRPEMSSRAVSAPSWGFSWFCSWSLQMLISALRIVAITSRHKFFRTIHNHCSMCR